MRMEMYSRIPNKHLFSQNLFRYCQEQTLLPIRRFVRRYINANKNWPCLHQIRCSIKINTESANRTVQDVWWDI